MLYDRGFDNPALNEQAKSPARLVALVIAAFFFYYAGFGLRAYFSPDDMQNLHKYWMVGFPGVIKANLLYWSSFYRPLGGLFYLPLYSLFGLHPLPYRIVCVTLLLLNLLLLYRFVARLAGSREIGALAVLIACFHAEEMALYISNATIYDILCFTFYFAAFVYYLRVRQSGRLLNVRETVVFALLYITSLDAKEMSVTLPVMVAIYELIWHRPASARFLDLWTWTRREFRTAAIAAVLTGIYIAGKMLGPDPLIVVQAYQPVFTLHHFLVTSRHYLNQLFYLQIWFNTVMTVGIWILLAAGAWLLKSKHLAWCSAFVIVSLLPVSFVPPREGFVLYIPMAGWSTYAATLLVAGWNLMCRRLEAGEGGERLRFPVLLTITILLLIPAHAKGLQRFQGSPIGPQLRTWHVIQELTRLHPQVTHGSRLLFIDDPFQGDWDMYFIAKLYFNDHSLQVNIQQSAEPKSRGDFLEPPDAVFRFQDGTLVRQK